MRRSFTSAGTRVRYKSDYIAPAVFLLVGGCFLVLTLVQLVSTAVLFTRTVPITGSYVGSVVHAGGNHGGMFSYPQFRYRTREGTFHTVTSTAGSTDEGYAEGETVSLRYDPEQPERTVVSSFWTLWMGPLFSGVFAAAFGLPGLLVLLALRRRPAT